MRVLSFVLAFLCVATSSFVAAVPATTSTSIVPSSTGGDAALQHIIDILSDTIARMQPLSDRLASATQSGSPDVGTISAIMNEMASVVSNATQQLDVAQQITVAAATYTDVGSILGAILQSVLRDLLGPVLSIVLSGGNTVAGSVIPLANTLAYVSGLILLLLQNLGALGLLGPNGLISQLLGILDGTITQVGGC